MKNLLFASIVHLTFMGFCIAATPAEPPTHDQISTSESSISIFPIEHATFVLTWSEMTLYVDPVGGPDSFEDFPRPDLILITHTHGDHMSAETVQGVCGNATIIVAPPAVAEEFKDKIQNPVIIVKNSETYEFKGGTVEAIPMYNLSPERERFHPKGQGNGYVLSLGGKRIYIAGDTEDIPEMRTLKNIDAAFVCMNLPYTMDVEHAASAVLDFKPAIVYPYHFRGKGGMSDIERFKKLVSQNPDIEVRLLKWY